MDHADGGAVDDDTDDDDTESSSTDSDEARRRLEKISEILKRKYGPRLILDELEPKDRHALDEAWHELVAS